MNSKLRQTALCEELIEARLIKRYKRFLADAEISATGEQVTVHCPNPGSMIGIAEAGSTIWLRPARNPRAKLKYGWVLTELPQTLVNVDTLMANKLLELALKSGDLPELRGYKTVLREKTFAESRFDFLLSEHPGASDCFMEVKSTTLAQENIAMFPDAKTERGRKHLQHLIACTTQGFRAVQFFCVGRKDTTEFKAAGHIDKQYADGLQLAAESGVEILAYDVDISKSASLFKFAIGRKLALL